MKNRAIFCIILFVFASCASQKSLRKENHFNDFSPGRFVYPMNNSEYLGNNGFQQLEIEYLPELLPSGLVMTTDWEQAQSVVLCNISRADMPSGYSFSPKYDPDSDSTEWIHEGSPVPAIRIEFIFIEKKDYLQDQGTTPWRIHIVYLTEEHPFYPDLLFFAGDARNE